MASILNSATNLLKESAATIADSIGEIASTLGLDFESDTTIKLPLPNVLHDFASYNYIIGLGVLTTYDLHNPDTTYMQNITMPSKEQTILICKTGGADPNNRVKTDYGRYEFFIDNLSIDSAIGLQNVATTNATTMTFTVTEPYSMGLFAMACQTASAKAGHQNWTDAPFLLTLEFRGNDEIGMMLPVRAANRYIPIKIASMDMKVTPGGAVYECSAYAWNDQGLSYKNSALKSDMAIKGSTVQEVLQTGEQSLQAVWNTRLKEFKTLGVVNVPDEVIILFPKDISSAPKSEGGFGGGATLGSASPEQVYEKLGTKLSSVNKTQVQDAEQVNLLGKAYMGYTSEKRPDVPFDKVADAWDEDKKVLIRAKQNSSKPTEGIFKFRQDTDIPNAINQILLSSDFPYGTFDPKALSPEGYRTWWRIDIQVYIKDPTANLDKTGVPPKIIVYRVIPYKSHSSRGIIGVNQTPVGYDKLLKNIVKEFNYTYTGKNIDVLDFNININASFFAMMTADAGRDTQDQKTSENAGQGKPDTDTINIAGAAPQQGTFSQRMEYISNLTGTDRYGGGGNDTTATRAARIYHDAITHGWDMLNIEMKIVGDPYFIAQSGMGNYTSKQTQIANLCTDGSVNWQGAEVVIAVNFRTPIDIQNDTGMYAFNGDMPTSPLMQFTGAFQITTLVSTFKGGKFEQTLSGFRYPMQESSALPVADLSFNLDNLVKKGVGFISDIAGI
jgi:hypothetical protein